MLAFKYTIAAVNLVFAFFILLLTVAVRKEDKEVVVTGLILMLLPVVNMLAILG